MEREQLREVLAILNNLFELDTLDEVNSNINNICKILGIENIQVFGEFGEFNENIFSEIISKIEREIKSEDEEYFYSELDENYISFIDSDEKKLELLDKMINNSSKEDVILSLQTDESKLKGLSTLSDDDSKARVIASLNSDESKIEVLSTLSDDARKAIVIASLNSDESKIEVLSTLSDDARKARVIESLKSDESKIEVLSTLSDDYSKERVIKSLKSDESKLKVLSELGEDVSKLMVITSLEEEFIKDKLENSEISDKNIELMKKGLIIKRLKPLNEIKTQKYTSFGLPTEMTIGMEIEAEGKSADLLIKFSSNDDEWKGKYDGSLISGVEVVSPILHDTEKDISRIYEITTAMQELKLETSERCGGHIHIGANYLKSIEELKELLEIYGNTEKIFYYISNKAGELPRKGVKEYALPISGKIEQSELKNSKEDVFIKDAQKVQEKRYSGINLMNMGINNVKNTVEFRLSNGTLNPEVWIENVRLYGKAVQIAHEIGQIKGKLKRGEQITEEEKHKLEIKETLKKEDIPDDEKMTELMELLFDEEERKVYEERYEINKELDEKAHIVDSLSFGRVDFEDVYDSVGVSVGLISELKENREIEQELNSTNESISIEQ